MTDSPERAALRPCPFCGAEWTFNTGADIFSHPTDDDRCPLEQVSIMNDPKEVARWNRRPQQSSRKSGGQ